MIIKYYQSILKIILCGLEVENYMFPEWFLNLPWNIFDTLISLIELLVVCIPAISIFIYYKIHTLSVWTKEVTNNGATLVIHNKSNKSIFITDIQFVNSENGCFEKACIMYDNHITQLKPDGYMEIVINYNKNRQNKHSFKVVVKYNQKKKKVKVTA